MKAKMVFNRIWRTFIIIINTIWNLLSTVLAFVMLFDSSSYNRVQNFEAWIYGMLVIIGVNVLNQVTRKHFENY